PTAEAVFAQFDPIVDTLQPQFPGRHRHAHRRPRRPARVHGVPHRALAQCDLVDEPARAPAPRGEAPHRCCRRLPPTMPPSTGSPPPSSSSSTTNGPSPTAVTSPLRDPHGQTPPDVPTARPRGHSRPQTTRRLKAAPPLRA